MTRLQCIKINGKIINDVYILIIPISKNNDKPIIVAPITSYILLILSLYYYYLI